MVTITSKKITDDGNYVNLVLSSGEEINVQVDWATQYVQESYIDDDGNAQWRDTDKTLLQQEIEQATKAAQARQDKAAADTAAAQSIINSI